LLDEGDFGKEDNENACLSKFDSNTF
jgi:hypothetical protein